MSILLIEELNQLTLVSASQERGECLYSILKLQRKDFGGGQYIVSHCINLLFSQTQ